MAVTLSLIVGTVPTTSTWLTNTTIKWLRQHSFWLAWVTSNGRRQMAYCLPNALYMPMTTCGRVAQHASSLMQWSRMGHGWGQMMMHQQHADVFFLFGYSMLMLLGLWHCNLNTFALLHVNYMLSFCCMFFCVQTMELAMLCVAELCLFHMCDCTCV